jgi:hypothetical protein
MKQNVWYLRQGMMRAWRYETQVSARAIRAKYRVCWGLLQTGKDTKYTDRDLIYEVTTMTRERYENHKPRNHGLSPALTLPTQIIKDWNE